MDNSVNNSEKILPDRKTIFVKWVWYPTISGTFFGIGHFFVYYLTL